MGGMMTMTVAMSLPLVFTSKRYHRTGRWITATSGLVSVAFGLVLVYRIGIVNGLFPPETSLDSKLKHDAII
jgi:high-affinity nickel-transport protein